MTKPTLPTRPSEDVEIIASDWICRLLDCVEYAMSHPDGDGKTIYRDANDTLSAAPPAQTGGSNEPIPDTSYKGYFTVISIPATESTTAKLKIIDGALPESTIAGRTDVGDVPVTEVDKQDGTLYLVCRYVNNSYVHSFEWSAPTSEAGVEEIATVANGKVVQRWTWGRVNWKWGHII